MASVSPVIEPMSPGNAGPKKIELKATGIAESGSHAKFLVEEGNVMVNGKTEYRKRAKLKISDIIEVHGQQIKIIS